MYNYTIGQLCNIHKLRKETELQGIQFPKSAALHWLILSNCVMISVACRDEWLSIPHHAKLRKVDLYPGGLLFLPHQRGTGADCTKRPILVFTYYKFIFHYAIYLPFIPHRIQFVFCSHIDWYTLFCVHIRTISIHIDLRIMTYPSIHNTRSWRSSSLGHRNALFTFMTSDYPHRNTNSVHIWSMCILAFSVHIIVPSVRSGINYAHSFQVLK